MLCSGDENGDLVVFLSYVWQRKRVRERESAACGIESFRAELFDYTTWHSDISPRSPHHAPTVFLNHENITRLSSLKAPSWQWYPAVPSKR